MQKHFLGRRWNILKLNDGLIVGEYMGNGNPQAIMKTSLNIQTDHKSFNYQFYHQQLYRCDLDGLIDS